MEIRTLGLDSWSFGIRTVCCDDLWLAAWVAQDGSFGGNMSDTSRAIGYISHSDMPFLCSRFHLGMLTQSTKLAKQFMVIAWKTLKAPSSWYQSTFLVFISKYLNTILKKHRYTERKNPVRFTGDLSLIDHNFTDTWDNAIQFSFIMIALVCVTSMIVPEMVPIFLSSSSVHTSICGRRANREAKRETNNANLQCFRP